MDHLSEDQITLLKQKLAQLKEETQRAIVALDKGSKPVDLNEPIGRLSRMDALAQQGLAQENLARLKLRAQLITQAEKRMTEGTYGICLKTDEPIAFERLSVMPETPIAGK